MPRKPGPRISPGPTPITEYLYKHPECSLMSIAKACGLNYDTVHKAERGCAVPYYVTLLKLEQGVGIPVRAWDATKAVQVHLAIRASDTTYAEKQERWRKKRRANDPVFRAKEDARFAENRKRQEARKRGEMVPPKPMSPLKAALKGLPPGTLEGAG
jgi:hypothetical protein